MSRSQLQEGRVEYSDRAFSQDAQQAMKGDIVRGLIELITNADDAYMEINVPRGRACRILVEVEHRKTEPWRVIVRDKASGIKDVVNRITMLGGRSSGFEKGEERRGNLGRGAKDLAAFGPVNFRTIRDDHYCDLLLRTDGTWTLLADRKATEADRQRIGIQRGSGTMVEVLVDPRFRCPRHDTLYKTLSAHFALRDIMSDPKRRVTLVNLNTGEEDPLVYQYLDEDVRVNQDVDIPGYQTGAHLRIWRLSERCDDGPYETSRPSGVLVKGAKAIYENTLFGLQQDIHSGWFGGELRCPLIDELAREIDNRREEGVLADALNPMSPILRGRDGLEHNHPVYKAIEAAVSPLLSQLMSEEAERARREEGRSVSDDTQRALDAVARELGRLINEEMKDIEAEELIGLPDEGDPPAIQLVPEDAYAYMGEDRTLTIAVRRDRSSIGEVVEVSISPEGVVELLTPNPSLVPHRRREDVLVGQIRLRPILSGEMTMVTACHDGECAEAIVTVRPERSAEVEIMPAPETLEFERARYQIGWKKTKTLLLRAPVELVESHGESVMVSCSSDGIVVRKPQCELSFDEEQNCHIALIQVEARALGASAEVMARCGEMVATTTVVVSRKEEAPGLRLKFDDEPPGFWRGLVDRADAASVAITTIRIMTSHPAVKPYVGRDLEHQDTPVCRQIISDIVADTAARMVVGDLYRMRGTTEDFDADRFYREHYKRYTKFLPRLQKILVGPPQLVASVEILEPSPLLDDA